MARTRTRAPSSITGTATKNTAKQPYSKNRLRKNAKTPEEARVRRNSKRPSRAKAAKEQREQLKRAEKALEEQKLREIFEVELTDEEKVYIMQAYRCGLAKGRRKRNKPNQVNKCIISDAPISCVSASCEEKTDDEVDTSSSTISSTAMEDQDLCGSYPQQQQQQLIASSPEPLTSSQANDSHGLQWKFGDEKTAPNDSFTDVDDYKILDIDMPEAQKMLAEDHEEEEEDPVLNVSRFRDFLAMDPSTVWRAYPFPMMP